MKNIKFLEAKLKKIVNHIIEVNACLEKNKQEANQLDAELSQMLAQESLETLSYETRKSTLELRRNLVSDIESKWQVIHFQKRQLINQLNKLINIREEIYSGFSKEEQKAPKIQAIMTKLSCFEIGLSELRAECE